MFRDWKIVLLASAALAPIGTPALAQDAAAGRVRPQADGSDPSSPDSDIIVTAQKREQRLIDVPASVSVISAEQLQQNHVDRFADYFTRVPSAAISEVQAGQTRLILRGVNTQGVGATVSTYVDEVPYGSATSLANGAFLTPDLDPVDVARVEVLRGPQGTLYGANSLGGVVKYVTVAPDLDAVHASAEGSFESVDHGDTGYSGRASVNLPVTDKLAVRASGFYRRDPGFIDDPLYGKDINDGRTYGGRLSVLFKPFDALTLRATAVLQDLNSNGTNQEDVNPVTLAPTLGRYRQSRVSEQPNDLKYRIYNLTGNLDLGFADLVSSTSWGNLDQDSIRDTSGVFTAALQPFFGFIGYQQEQDVTQRRFTQEVRLSSQPSKTLDWSIGGFYTRERNEIHQVINGLNYTTGAALPPFAGVLDARAPSTYREYAGFANGTVHLTRQFDVTLGGRYSHNEQDSAQSGTGVLATALGIQPNSGSSSDDVFTYSVAPSFKPNEQTTIYARVARGYRPGGPNIIPPGAPAGVPRQYAADTTTNYEAGIKSELFDRRLSLELTGFYIDWKDIILFTSISGVGVNANGGGARSKGVEFTASVVPADGLTLSANGAYVDAYLTKDSPVLVGGVKGDDLPYTAKFAGTLSAEYERALAGDTRVSAGASWRYTGSRRSNFDTAFGQRRLDPFSQVDAHAGVTFDRFRIDAFARNITNSRGILDLGSAGSALNGLVTAAINRPRSYGLTLGFRY